MNARTVRKILVRGRRGSFFGERARLTVRLPWSIFPVPPPPPMPANYVCNGLSISYTRLNDKGEPEHTLDFWESCTVGPVRDKPNVYFEWADPWMAGDEVIDQFRHWTIEKSRVDDPKVEVPVTAEDVAALEAHLALKDWKDAVQGVPGSRNLVLSGVDGHFDTRRGLCRPFYRAREHAKTMAIDIDYANRCVYLTYGVKYFQYPARGGFCSELAAAMRKAKKHGVPVRIFKRPRF